MSHLPVPDLDPIIKVMAVFAVIGVIAAVVGCAFGVRYLFEHLSWAW